MQNPSTEELSERAKYGSLWYVIPSAVYDDDRLHGDEILFYVLVSNLANKFGYCYASDEWFAQKRKVDERTIKRWMEHLESLGYIKRDTQKIGMKWDRKIYILPVPPPSDSNKVYEGTNGAEPRGHTKGQKCPFRGDENVPIIEKEENIRTTTTPTPSSNTRKELLREKMRKKFGGEFQDEVFENAFSELSLIDPATITSVDGLLATIMDKWLVCKPKAPAISEDERTERIGRHRQEAIKKQVLSGESRIEPMETLVYFRSRRGICPISYDLSDDEWKNQTGWK